MQPAGHRYLGVLRTEIENVRAPNEGIPHLKHFLMEGSSPKAPNKTLPSEP